MSRYEVVPATRAHAEELAPRMRRQDVEEVGELGFAPLPALVRSLEGSRHAYAGLVDGNVVCMFGIGARGILSDEGVPWLLASDEMERHAFTFLKLNRAYITCVRKEFRWLHNYVSPRNVAAIRWLNWLGFTVASATTPLGPKGAPMLYFEMRDV